MTVYRRRCQDARREGARIVGQSEMRKPVRMVIPASQPAGASLRERGESASSRPKKGKGRTSLRATGFSACGGCASRIKMLGVDHTSQSVGEEAGAGA